MKIKQILLFGLLLLIIISAKGQSIKTNESIIKIIEPKEMDSVKWQTLVKGIVIGEYKEIWLVVHPIGLQDRWVQPKVSIKSDTTWQTIVYIAQQGNEYVGNHYEIKAFVDPKENLYEGKILNDWPDAKYSSFIIEVIRKGK